MSMIAGTARSMGIEVVRLIPEWEEIFRSDIYHWRKDTMKHGKKYVESAKLIDRSKLYDTAEALDICVKTGNCQIRRDRRASCEAGRGRPSR